MSKNKIGIIGFGEAARAFASSWTRPEDAVIAAYDVKISMSVTAAEITEACAALDVVAAAHVGEALNGTKIIFSLVTADQASIAAQLASEKIDAGAYYFDCNSCSPATKITSAGFIEKAGGHYVDVAVMSPVHPARNRTPLLVSGPDVDVAIETLIGLGMNPKTAGTRIGQASSIKMLRSVFIKGLEALTAESLLAARRAGVEDAVIASLQASDPGIDWATRSAYNLERMMVHGARRAAEMREVARTVKEFGLPNRLSVAIADWQDEIAVLGTSTGKDDLASRADAILARMPIPKGIDEI